MPVAQMQLASPFGHSRFSFVGEATEMTTKA
jgi:hypothetical protein